MSLERAGQCIERRAPGDPAPNGYGNPAAGDEHAPHLGQDQSSIPDELQAIPGDGLVERGVGERKPPPLGGAGAEIDIQDAVAGMHPHIVEQIVRLR